MNNASSNAKDIFRQTENFLTHLQRCAAVLGGVCSKYSVFQISMRNEGGNMIYLEVVAWIHELLRIHDFKAVFKIQCVGASRREKNYQMACNQNLRKFCQKFKSKKPHQEGWRRYLGWWRSWVGGKESEKTFGKMCVTVSESPALCPLSQFFPHSRQLPNGFFRARPRHRSDTKMFSAFRRKGKWNGLPQWAQKKTVQTSPKPQLLAPSQPYML